MSKAVLVSALFAGGALLLAAAFFQPPLAPDRATAASPALPLAAGSGEEPISPTIPTRDAPSSGAVTETPPSLRAPVRRTPPIPHGLVRLSGYVRVGASERNRGEPVPDAVVRLVPDGSRRDALLAASILMESRGDLRDLAVPSEGKELGRAVTDERGRFLLETRLPVLPLPMSASLTAGKAGWSEALPLTGDLEIQPPLERDDLIAYLVPSLVLTGSVAEAATGSPIAGARVEASPSQHPARDPGLLPPSRGTTADAAGRFRVNLGGAREADLLVSAHGFLTGLVRIVRGSVPADLRIGLARAEDLPAIEGRVTHADGSPCPEARLSLDILRPLDGANRDPRQGDLPASRQFIGEAARREDHRPGPDGAFRVLLPFGGTWMVRARCGSFEGKNVVEVPARGATSCQVALDEDCRLRVRVVDETGKPVVATVYVRWEGGFLGSTTREGAIDLRMTCRTGPCRVQAEHEGRRSAEVAIALERPGTDHDLGTLVLTPPTTR